MGLFDFFTRGKKAEEITCAAVGGYVFSRLRDNEQREVIIAQIYRTLSESGPFPMTLDEAQEKFNTSPAIVQTALMVNAMIDLGIDHDVRGFHWDYIPNPFALEYYPEKAALAAASNLRNYGIDPEDCFNGPSEI